jgi:ADP-ribosylglycohydrolase
MKKALEIVDNAKGEFMDAWLPLHDELWTSYKASVPEAVAAAFGVLKLVNKDFRTGVVAAGNFGRDADTIGAIVGAILGAKYGASQMPERWIEKTRYPSGTCLAFTNGLDIKEVAQKLSELIK